MQKLIAAIFILIFHLAPLINGATYVDFLLNQDYIKVFLCINKEYPKTSCNGKCYLSKQLKKTKNESQNEFPELINTKHVFNISSVFKRKLKQFKSLNQQPQVFYINTYKEIFSADTSYPPWC